MKRKNSPVWEMTFLHCLVETKEIAVGGVISNILYSCLPIVTMTLQGLESYTKWCFHIYGWTKITSQTLIEETSHNTSSLKGLMP
jgi:hypothetical protein